MPDLDQLIGDLQSDSAKRRWATLQKIGALPDPDLRLLPLVEILSNRDPIGYVREEATRVLALPTFQTLKAANPLPMTTTEKFYIIADESPSKILNLLRWVWGVAFISVWALGVGWFLYIVLSGMERGR